MSTPSVARSDPPASAPPPSRPSAHRSGQRSAWVLAGVAIAVLGGAIALALALLVGAVHTSATTTVVESAPVNGARASATGTWAAVYASDQAGQVAITVQTTTVVNTPFGQRKQNATARGSGFVVDNQGDIVTAAHVIDGAGSVRVTFTNGTARSATILGKDNASDIAVLHISPSGLTLHPLVLGASATLAVGDPMAVIGDPLGFEHSMSTGVVSALNRTIQAPNGFEIAHAIQTDAAMNPGNSGGPLVNTSGEVIGIADQIATGTNQFGGPSNETTSTGVGFAVPISLIKAELPALEKGQRVAHAYLGVGTGQPISGAAGVLVVSVGSGSPAAKAGLRAGDVIIALDGHTLGGESALIDTLAAAHPGQNITMTVRRGTRRLTLTVTLGTQPSQAGSG